MKAGKKIRPAQKNLFKYLRLELKPTKKCLSCSRSLGFWERVLLGRKYFCKSCYEEVVNGLNEGIRRYENFIIKALSDGKLTPKEQDELEEIAKKYQLTTLACKIASINAYYRLYQKVVSDRKVTEDELAQINELCQKLQLPEKEISPTLQTLAKLHFLTQLEEGILPEIDADIFLKRNEVAHYQTNCELYEERIKREYVGGHSGVSIRVAKGVYWRVGGFKGYPVEKTVLTKIDQGKLVITNKRIVFSGDRKSFSIPYSKLIDIELFKDAVKINREGKKRKEFFVVPEPEILAKVITLAVNQ